MFVNFCFFPFSLFANFGFNYINKNLSLIIIIFDQKFLLLINDKYLFFG